jgi:hypothetical protein
VTRDLGPGGQVGCHTGFLGKRHRERRQEQGRCHLPHVAPGLDAAPHPLARGQFAHARPDHGDPPCLQLDTWHIGADQDVLPDEREAGQVRMERVDVEIERRRIGINGAADVFGQEW